jgi:hypothetical protein
VKVPYALTAAVAVPQRYAQMSSAIARSLPRLQRITIDPRRTLSIACYGPSLAATWRELKPPILSMSGATKWLVEHGVTPTYHIDMDPRANKIMTSLPAVPGVHYLVASVCVPEYFDALLEAGVEVTLWHTVSSNWEQDLRWVAEHDPDQLVISTGSTIGLAGIQLGGLLGYSRFDVHGMDASFLEGQRHAGAHHGKTQKPNIVWPAGGKKYYTSKIMANAAAETVNTARNCPIFLTFFGDGLTQALIKEADLLNACCADQPAKRAAMATRTAHVLDLPPIPKGRGTPWDAWLTCLKPGDVTDLIAQIPVCEARRSRARYNTGSVPLETAVLLRAVSRYYRPDVIAEVGTFIGTSTAALVPGRALYTCDRSNDCLPSTETVLTHPYRSSTEMFREIQEPVDLFFLDGRLTDDDLGEIRRLKHPKSVFFLDDCTGQEKGVVNTARLMPHLPGYVVIPPPSTYQGRSTLGAIVPRGFEV